MSIASMIAKGATTLTHQRRGTTQDTIGGRRNTWSTVASGVRCWMQPATARTLERYRQQQMIVTHSVYVQQDLACQANDRLVIGSRTLIVKGQRDSAGLGRLWEIDVEES